MKEKIGGERFGLAGSLRKEKLTGRKEEE